MTNSESPYFHRKDILFVETNGTKDKKTSEVTEKDINIFVVCLFTFQRLARHRKSISVYLLIYIQAYLKCIISRHSNSLSFPTLYELLANC